MRNQLQCNQPIGLFDSGAGGLTVLAAAVRLLPRESFLYYGDTAHAPYGGRSAAQVRELSLAAGNMLYRRGCKALVVACNTATSAAVASLREELPIPVIGMEPAVKPALQRGGRVLVMATPLTLREEKFKRLCRQCGADAENVTVLPCPGLVEMVERGHTGGPEVEKVLRELFAAVELEGVSAVVLGCTHYLYLRGALAGLLPEGAEFVDGNGGTVRQLQRVLEQQGLLCDQEAVGTVELLSSGGPEAIRLFQILYEKAFAETEGM
jgi:glutamate racemase